MAEKEKPVVGEHENTWGATEAYKADWAGSKAEPARKATEKRNKEASAE